MRRLVIHSVEEVVAGPDIVLARDLKAARQKTGLTRMKLAQKTGIALGELVSLEAGELATFASPERARMVLLAYCDALGLQPASFLGRLEPYLANQLLVPQSARAGSARNSAGIVRAATVVAVAFLAAWQVATLFANASAGRGVLPAAGAEKLK